jgi:hypothetical protein
VIAGTDSHYGREEIHNSYWTDEKIGVFYFVGTGGGADFRSFSVFDPVAIVM